MNVPGAGPSLCHHQRHLGVVASHRQSGIVQGLDDGLLEDLLQQLLGQMAARLVTHRNR